MTGDDWRDGGPCADEYDGYLLQVVGRLRRGVPRADVVAYLDEMETDRMGLSRTAVANDRAAATVAAISAYLETLPAGPPNVR